MEAQDKINAYAKSVNKGNPADDATYICPYFHMYPWYDSYLESSLWASELKYMDVITVDGMIDAEEYARAYMQKDPVTGERRFSPQDAKYVELFRLIKQMTKYYPANYSSYYAEQQFLVGNLAMLEVVGGSIREIVDTVDGAFEIGVMPYPVLTKQPKGEASNPYYTTFDVDNFVRRGFSGYSTGWAITNSAMNKDNQAGNTNCVDACVDMLMYLSCFENNDKMVNENAGEQIYNRVIDLEIRDKIVENGQYIAKTIKENYGFAGKDYIRYIQKIGFEKIFERFIEIFNEVLEKTSATDKQANSIACILLANQLGNACIFEDNELLSIDDLKDYINDKNEVKTAMKAKNYIINLIDINHKKFEEGSGYGESWGIRTDYYCLINAEILRRELKKEGFEFETVKKDWLDMDFLELNSQGRYLHNTTANKKKGTYVRLKM
jgi:uncharacterized protein involved in tolerance to divalent cations